MKIILDTDFGDDIDDTFALYSLLQQAGEKISLILSAFGQTKKRAELIYEFLERYGRTDIPVGIGEENAAYRDPYMYRFFDKHSCAETYPLVQDGVEKAKELIDENDDVVIIAIGPTTNLAKLAEICPKAKDVPIYAMFGSIYKGYFGGDKPDREWNVLADPFAAQRTLAFYKNMKIAPLDTCGIIQFEGETYQNILQESNPVIEDYKKWLTLGYHKDENKSSVQYDTQPIYMLLDGEMLVYKTLPLCCDNEGNITVDSKGHLVQCALEWKDFSIYMGMLEKVFINKLSGL